MKKPKMLDFLVVRDSVAGIDYFAYAHALEEYIEYVECLESFEKALDY